MKALKIFLVLLLIGIIVIQFFPVGENIDESIESGADFAAQYDVPASVQETLKASCYDCHSNNTVYLWYDKVQPVGWYIKSHVDDGKKELNFDEFASYSAKKQQHKLEEIAEVVEEGEMPLTSYTLTRPHARLTGTQKEEFVNYFEKLARREESKLKSK
ncbi:MAG: heme-binding domain-containing protein [Salinimicrobium sp.]